MSVKYFILNRTEDVSGISGTGIIAEGIVFEDGHVAYRWLSDMATTTFADDLETIRKLHGHDGKTELIVKIDKDFLNDHKKDDKKEKIRQYIKKTTRY